MPIYEYRCEICGKEEERVLPMSADIPSSVPCTRFAEFGDGACKGTAHRVYSFASGNTEYNNPIISQSLAVHPEQAAEHRAAFPDVKLKDNQFPVFENYQQHDKYLEKSGFVKRKGMHTRLKNRHGVITKRVTMGDVHRRLETEQGNTETVLPPEKE